MTIENRKYVRILILKVSENEPNKLSVIFNNIDKKDMAKKGNTFLDVF